MKQGIVVLGHGSRAAVGEATRVVFQVTEIIKGKVGHDLVETAIMNRDSNLQTIEEAIKKLVERGVSKVTIVPMFLTDGAHIKQDIPEELDGLKKELPGIEITLAGHIGPDPRIADILIERVREAQ